MMRYISWFSAGCSSFFAAYLMRDKLDHCVYIDIADQHPDSMRFVRDAEKLLGLKIEIIRSEVYKDVDDVNARDRFMSAPWGAPCTKHLKREVRERWEKEHDISRDDVYIWGFDASKKERKRAMNTTSRMTYVDHEFPLIDADLTKPDVHAMCEDLGIKRPAMYDLGYPNNNCIGCVKGGAGYWNKIRVDFPEVFELRAKREREIGGSCLNGVFLDELDPKAGRLDEVFPSCSIMCQLAEMDMEMDMEMGDE